MTIETSDHRTCTLMLLLKNVSVNSDGTLSRISNWHEMTPPEQERTVRLIAKRRNQERMKALQKKEDEEQAAKE